jgi:hypothetical protein
MEASQSGREALILWRDTVEREGYRLHIVGDGQLSGSGEKAHGSHHDAAENALFPHH